MSAALKKIEGIETVDVSVDRGSIDITLKPDNTVTLPMLRRTIRSNGNETKEAQVTAKGRIADRDQKPVFDLLNGATMELEATPKAPRSGIIEVTGVATELTRDSERLTVVAVKQVTK